MTAAHRRIAFWSVLVLVLVVAVGYLFRPQPIPVDLIAAKRGTLAETVAEEGETRIKDVFVLSAPVAGLAKRIDMEPGDKVAANETVIAEIEPIDPSFLDVRSEAEAKAAVETAKAAHTYAIAELTQAQANLEFARLELERARKLIGNETISQRAFDEAERTFKIRQAEVETAKAGVEMRKSELEQAEVRLLSPAETRSRRADCTCIPVKSPISGEILRVLHESEGVVTAGEPLVEIGNPRAIEIVVDFISFDAVRIEPGQRVIIEEWGGSEPLNGRVTKVEPYGYKKISALGIEEQRVNVVIDLTDPPELWRRLGHGFQVEARVVIWEGNDVLKLPLTALFREGGKWAVFAVRDGRAVLRPVTVGHRNEIEIEIIDGIAEGEVVLRYPNDRISDGIAVEAR